MLGVLSMHGASITTTSDYIALWDAYHRLYSQNRWPDMMNLQPQLRYVKGEGRYIAMAGSRCAPRPYVIPKKKRGRNPSFQVPAEAGYSACLGV